MHYRLREAVRGVGERQRALAPQFNERTRRLTAAAEARALGYGGITAVGQVYGMRRATIHRGLRDLPALEQGPLPGHIRRPGAGRRRRVDADPTLAADLTRLVDPVTRGDPESPLRWTATSGAKLTVALRAQGHVVGATTVGPLLKAHGYSLQANQKRWAGADHPERDAQFPHIADHAKAYLQRGLPVISVDAKKKELVGDFKNPGREWHPAGHPPGVQCHDFVHLGLGKACP